MICTLFQDADEYMAKVEILTMEEDQKPNTPAHGAAIEKSKRITTRYMTKYERARVLGTRALQIR